MHLAGILLDLSLSAQDLNSSHLYFTKNSVAAPAFDILFIGCVLNTELGQNPAGAKILQVKITYGARKLITLGSVASPPRFRG